MTQTLRAGILALLVVTPLQAQTPDTVTFNNWVKQSISNGQQTDEMRVTLTLTPDSLLVKDMKPHLVSEGPIQPLITIPYTAITRLIYDRRTRTRKMAPTYGKRQQHFLTIQYKTGTVGEFVEFEFSKDIAAHAMATLEARSGQKIEIIGS